MANFTDMRFREMDAFCRTVEGADWAHLGDEGSYLDSAADTAGLVVDFAGEFKEVAHNTAWTIAATGLEHASHTLHAWANRARMHIQ